ncbi:hypothetical protein LOZ12_004627 [Ophidiomyces ophidiicola]|uniref:Uncharacterized protein n=1 Tax=Ophidiomyces ophidiicola TaxID=1387563 RepID=A0ACB8V5W8_9EURO|nr:hypothetical protein LOZ61_001361 [Ophidiomyces ophidiicola]KAI1930548.1 hypothetical protein LOZ60_000779 [Ophidiomyces ophidiicola]KAI1940819.1 hypothetical protein LOZ62_004846 [Ophidiomyces ophidiicola]KAI1965512.1 hypothetical protein LOZ59_001323 [Ophidiomyces ophidiicola]KAI1969949.1 hypothetical protein LOZ56_004038 [Ophidiomyces ophidiicola]
MSASAVGNTSPVDSKSSKKKRGKAETPATPPTPSAPESASVAESTANGAGSDFSYLKDLQKYAFPMSRPSSLRNATKKLNATAKVDTIVAENPGLSLDDLVAAKKINADQKAQMIKKPALQENVASIEEQISQFKQYGAHYEERLAKQKAELEKTHQEQVDAIKKDATADARQTAEKDFKEKLLILSKFLRAAAAMRRSGDENSTDSRAFEGLLFQVYGGTDEAVDAMEKLIKGAEENVTSVDGDAIELTYERVKQASLDYQPPAETWTEEAQQSTESILTSSAIQATDPTLANAGMTELQDQSLMAQVSTMNSSTLQPAETVPAQAVVANDSANAVAQAAWATQPAMSSSQMTEEWVNVENPDKIAEALAASQEAPRPPFQSSNSWADDIPVAPLASTQGVQQVDGFEPVLHHNRQNSGRGRGFRGRGPRGDGYRGRGGYFRGDRGDFRGRGRGRGEFRGGRGRGSFSHQAGETGPAQ